MHVNAQRSNLVGGGERKGERKWKPKAYFKIRLYQDDAEVQRFSNTAGNGMVADVICR